VKIAAAGPWEAGVAATIPDFYVKCHVPRGCRGDENALAAARDAFLELKRFIFF
jgi:hypothetical protein